MPPSKILLKFYSNAFAEAYQAMYERRLGRALAYGRMAQNFSKEREDFTHCEVNANRLVASIESLMEQDLKVEAKKSGLIVTPENRALLLEELSPHYESYLSHLDLLIPVIDARTQALKLKVKP